MWLQQRQTELSRFPWRASATTLRERFREDRLGVTASSLTFTTIMALVPFFTVVLAVFTAFPMFAQLQDVLQKWLIESLVPDAIARPVLGSLTMFATKASKLGVAGVAFLLATALALIFTIDRTLNNIWRVPRLRPLGQRVLIYWAAITLGPLLLGGSLAVTSYVLSASKGVVGALPGGVRFLLDVLEFLLLAAGLAALYHYVPNTRVRWGHAWTGGLLVASSIELAKKLLTLYLAQVPTYSMIYGAFAAVPIFLLWIYLAWGIVLAGAVVTAYLPSFLSGVARRTPAPGWRFQLALEVLQQLHQARPTWHKGLTLSTLEQTLRVEALQLAPVLEALKALDWVGELTDGDGRHVLLVEPADTPIGPLMQKLLLAPTPATDGLWKNPGWPSSSLADAL